MMTDRTGCKVSPHSESIDGYREATPTIQFRSIAPEVSSGCSLEAGHQASDTGMASDQGRDAISTTCIQTTEATFVGERRGEEGDIVLLRASDADSQGDVRGPFPVTYRPAGTSELTQKTSQPAAAKRTKSTKKVKRRAKSDGNFDVPAALKSLRRRPRSGFPQRPSIISRRGVYPQFCGEEQWGDEGNESRSHSDDRWRTFRSDRSVPETEVQGRDSRANSSSDTLGSCSRGSWADVESNDDSSSCSSPLDSGRQVSQCRSSQETSGADDQMEASRTSSPSFGGPEADLCSRLQEAVISSGEGHITPDIVSTNSQSDVQSGAASGFRAQGRNRDSMALALVNPLGETNPAVVGSRIRLDRYKELQEDTATTNIFMAMSSQSNSHVTSPLRTRGASATIFDFPDQQSNSESLTRTASVAPAPFHPRSAATLNCSVVTPPQQSNGTGRKGKGRRVPKDYCEIPAALRSLRRKPRSGFGQRTNRMQVGPQVSVRGAHGGDQQTLVNVEMNDNTAANTPNTNYSTARDTTNTPNENVVQDPQPVGRLSSSLRENQQSTIRQQPAQTRSQIPGCERIASPIQETIQSNDRSRGLDPAALQSLRRHPRSGFRRNRPTVSSHFTAVSSEATPSSPTGDISTRPPSSSVQNEADDMRRESQENAAYRVIVSRRPALGDPNHSPPPAYDNLFFYSVGDDVADVFIPEEFRPQLPSYEDVLRLSQDSPPPYIEAEEVEDDNDTDS